MGSGSQKLGILGGVVYRTGPEGIRAMTCNEDYEDRCSMVSLILKFPVAALPTMRKRLYFSLHPLVP